MPKMSRYLTQEEPVVLYCERETDLSPGARFGPVIREYYVIEMCTEGFGSAIINGKEFPVGPGDCYVLLPGDSVIHTASKKNPRRGMWFGVSGLQMGKHLSRAGITSHTPFAPPEVFEELLAWGQEMLRVWHREDAGAPLRLTGLLYGFLSTLIQAREGSATGVEWVLRAQGLMESRYHEEDLSVARIASEVGLERAYFSTLFKKELGMTPHRYLNALRIRKAKLFLRLPTCSVTQSASLVGMDPKNFARIFKRETGLTPQEYKKSKIG